MQVKIISFNKKVMNKTLVHLIIAGFLIASGVSGLFANTYDSFATIREAGISASTSYGIAPVCPHGSYPTWVAA